MQKSKIVIILVVALITTPWLLAQTPYYDSKALLDSGWITPPAGEVLEAEVRVHARNAARVLPLLYPYLNAGERARVAGGADAATKFRVYQNAFQDNPFISLAGTLQSNQLQGVSIAAEAAAARSLSSIASADISTVVDGLARFLVKRARQELTITFFERFNKILKKQKDLQYLFPTTYSVLTAIQDEIYNYQLYLSALRDACATDIDNLLNNAYTWTKAEDAVLMKSLATNRPEGYQVLKIGLFAGGALARGEHPGAVIHQLAAFHKVGALQKDDAVDYSKLHPHVAPALNTIDLFSQALRASSTKRYWISRDEFHAFSDRTFVTLFMGLVYQQTRNSPIVFTEAAGGPLAVDSLMEQLAAGAENHRRFIADVQGLLTDLRDAFEAIESQIVSLRSTDVRKSADYARLIDASWRASETIMNNHLFRTSINFTPDPVLKYYASRATALWSHLETGAYPSAVFELSVWLDSALQGEEQREVLQPLLKYGTLAANLAVATTAEEVEMAIEVVALPAGSASIKRKTKTNISLNAFLGLSLGREWNDDHFRDYHTTFGMSAPIGVAFSRGFRSLDKEHKGDVSAGSISVFLSLVDLGAVTAYRFNDDQTEPLPKLTLSNIFSPGLQFIYGIPNTPLSFGIGAQMGPQLREISGGATQLNDDVAFSGKAFIAVDIPLLNFLTKPW